MLTMINDSDAAGVRRSIFVLLFLAFLVFFTQPTIDLKVIVDGNGWISGADHIPSISHVDISWVILVALIYFGLRHSLYFRARSQNYAVEMRRVEELVDIIRKADCSYQSASSSINSAVGRCDELIRSNDKLSGSIKEFIDLRGDWIGDISTVISSYKEVSKYFNPVAPAVIEVFRAIHPELEPERRRGPGGSLRVDPFQTSQVELNEAILNFVEICSNLDRLKKSIASDYEFRRRLTEEIEKSRAWLDQLELRKISDIALALNRINSSVWMARKDSQLTDYTALIAVILAMLLSSLSIVYS